MTTATLHPIVLEKLQRFRRQRQRLILWRGLCGVLAIWLGAMMGVALVDRWLLIPDGLRLGLSGAGYLATGFLFWIKCGRYLFHVPDARELARLLELAAPQLREELLSAVELSESKPQPHWDSNEFRAALQQAVARDVGGLKIEGLLTKKLIAGWFQAALAVAVILGVLLCAPGLRFPHSFARAVLPAANLARYSAVEITVLAPTPPDQVIPEGDNVPVTVGLRGPTVEPVILEIIPHHGPRERIPMALSAVNQFTAAVQLNQTPLQFRIHARDAITRKYTLTPRPRPHVVRFQKTYHYPAYSGLPARTVTEENGDLDALEGTEVELQLAVAPVVVTASLQIETGSGKTIKTNVPLASAGNGTLIAHLLLTAPGTYQTHLVAAETGFENKFSPQSEIRVRPDLIPAVKIDRPDRDQLVLPPEAVINLAGTAKDDLALASVVQAIQVNRGDWKVFPLIQTTNAEVKVARTWDLFDLSVTPGDRILTKLIATDRKGQRGESAPLRILIATADFDPNRLKNLQEREAVDQSIHELREAAEQVEAKTREARTVVNNPAADLVQKKQALLAAAAATLASQRKADEVLNQIKEAIPHATARESADLALVGSAISRVQHEGLTAVQAALERATEHTATGADKTAKADLEKLTEPLAAVGLTRVADDAQRQMLAAIEANTVVRDLQQLANEQRAVNDQLRTGADNAVQAERAAHRQTVAINEVKAVVDQLKTLGEHSGGNPANTARSTERDLDGVRDKLEKALSIEPTIEKLKGPSDQLQHTAETAAANLRTAERELAQRADTARKGLQDQTGTAADAITKLADQLLRRDSPTAPAAAWQAATDQLNDRAALEERRSRPNSQFVATAGQAAAALQALQEIAGDDPPTTNTLATVKAVEQAFRKLQTGQAIDEEVAGLRQLAGQERWEKPTTPAALADRANDWKWAQQQLQSLPQQLERAQLSKEAKLAIETTGQSPSAQQVDAEMNQRRADPASARDVAEPLTKLAGEIAQARQQLQPALDQARAELDQRAPSLSDRLAGLSRAAEKLNSETTTQAQAAGKSENAKPVQTAAQNLAAAQQHLDNRLEDVKVALRRDANVQNLAAAEGRERARDADDALALLSKPKPSPVELLHRAANPELSVQQQGDLKSAAEQQAKLAADLKQLAEHYQNADAGHPEPTRSALRETEKELGLKPTLDAEYAKAQALEKLAGLTPSEQLAELEKTLPDSKAMRHELSDIAQAAVRSATANLQKSANQEQQLAQQIGGPAEQARRIADEAQKLAQQGIPELAQKAGPTGAAAKADLADAVQKLADVAQNVPQDFAKPPAQLAQAMQNQVAPLQQAATDLTSAANKLEQAAQTAQQQAAIAAQQAKANPAKADAAKQASVAQQQAQAAVQQAQAAKQQAQQASQQAGQLAQESAQLAKVLAQAQPPPPLTPAQQAAVAQAKKLAEEVRELAQQAVPAVAEKAGATGETAKPDLTQAGQKLEGVAKNIPADLAKPPDQLAQTVANQALPLQQAANDLNNAANRLGEAATAAEQKAVVAAQQAEQGKASKAGESVVHQAETAQHQAEIAAQQARAAKQQALQAGQQATHLAQQANQMADALKEIKPVPPTVVQRAALEQAKQLAEAVQKLATQAIPAVAAQTGPAAKPDLLNAQQKLTGVADHIPQDPALPAEQQIQALRNQIAPLQQAATDLNRAANKLGDAASAAKQQAAAAAQQAAQAKAAKAGEPSVQRAEAAQQQAQAAAQQAQAAQQQAQQASQQAGQLAQQAGQVAQAMDQAQPPTAGQQAGLEQAQQIAAAAQKLAQQNIPAVAESATEAAKPDLALAVQKLTDVAKNIPQDFGKPVAQVAQAVQNQIAPLQQAAADLNNAARKLGKAVDTAQQQATVAEKHLQQIQTHKPSRPETITEAETAAQQAQATVQQAQGAQRQVLQASQQAGQLAQQASSAAAALNQPRPTQPTAVAPPVPTPMQAAAAQQPAIEQAVREAGTNIERAGRHEARLGQGTTGQQLEQLGQQVEQQAVSQIEKTQPALAQAANLAQAQHAAQSAQAAIQSPLNQLVAATQQPPVTAGNVPPAPALPNPLAAAPDESAKWLARTLDSLDAALNGAAPAAGPSAQSAPSQPGQPASGQPGSTAQNTAAIAATAAAHAQSATMAEARANGLAPGQQPLASGGSQGSGAEVAANGRGMEALPTVKPTAGHWGKLPPKLAHDLLDSQHEGVGGEYREMVDLYYRAIAEKAREKRP